jgi:two-component system, sensor histidine kinase
MLYIFFIKANNKITPMLPKNESTRLATPHTGNVLDTPRQERYNRITRTVQRLLQAPIALIALVDDNRIWFRSAQGLSITQIPRDGSFCGQAILGDEILVIPDALLDPRFADNILVKDEPYLRFYAGRPLSAADGSKLGTLCIYDRQPRQMTEAELQSLDDLGAWTERELLADEQAQQITRLKSEFLANMTHELRTPMNGVLGMARLLLDTTLTNKQQEYVETIRASGSTLLKIIDHILDFSTLEVRTPVTVEFSLASVVENVARIFRPEAERKSLTLTTQIDSQIPSALIGDPDWASKALFHLVDNAVKFTEMGKIVVRASLESTMGAQATIRFTVRDTGVGISAATINRLFQPFVQADGSASRKYSGTGLGLAMSRRLIEMMGGKLDVESKEGAGSIFWFTLPLQLPVTPTKESSAPASQPTPARPRDVFARPIQASSGSLVLLAEDHPVNRRLTALQLQRFGYEVYAVTTGKQAVAAIVDKPDHGFGLILMDCQMPEMDGLEATRIIRQSESESSTRIPIIAMTANAMDKDRQACFAAGMDDFLAKPIDLDQLCHVLEQWVSPGTSAEEKQR